MTGTQHRPHRLSTSHRILLWVFFLCLFVPGGVGFIQKLLLFFKSFHASPEGGFTILPVLTYLIVAAGMMLLFFWAVSHGMFRNVEQPKYTQLDVERQLDEEEGIDWDQQNIEKTKNIHPYVGRQLHEGEGVDWEQRDD